MEDITLQELLFDYETDFDPVEELTAIDEWLLADMEEGYDY